MLVDQSLKTWNTFLECVWDWEPMLREIYGDLNQEG